MTEGSPVPDAYFRELERARLRSLVDGDLSTARTLHASDYQLITPSGRSLSRAAYLGDIESGALRYEVFEPASEIAVVQLGGGAAVRYEARIDVHFHGGGSDRGRFWHTDLYRLRDGTWQAVWSQATRIPE
jgi:hypothetical protein